MTADIVELARQHRRVAQTHYEGCEADHVGCLVNKLADEVDRQRADNERLREVLKETRERLYLAVGHTATAALMFEEAHRKAQEGKP